MPGLRGPDGDPERRRHVGQRHPEVVVQDDDRALLRLQAPRAPHRAGRDRPRSPRCPPPPVRRPVQRSVVGPVASERTPDSIRLVATTPIAPTSGTPIRHRYRTGRSRLRSQASGGNRIRSVEQVPPGSGRSPPGQRSARSGSRSAQAGRTAQPRERRNAAKQRKGVMIAPLGSLDEFSLVHDSPGVGAPVSCALAW